MSGRPHNTLRLFEWMTSLMMIGIASTIAYDPHSVPKGGFYLMQNVGLTPESLTLLFLLAGAIRISCLYANGRWPFYGPWCRVLCAIGGVFVWGQMAVSLAEWSTQTGYLSIGVPVYIFLAAGEIMCCFRAARDAGIG